MTIRIMDSIYAEGTPADCGIFLSCYLVCLKTQTDAVKTEQEKQRVMNDLLSNIKSIQIREEKGDEDGRDAHGKS